ncbi:MAG TPA: PilZ domain-containing protein [Vicinamibacterales bacterium]|nr:PilZ domain-containing protein [Vicinamibacterales bacterium]
MTNTRDSERIPTTGQVTGEVTVYEPMTILDLSDRGAQVETKFPLHLDSLHEFRLSLGTRSVVVKGRIAHCQIGELGETILYRSGIEFIEPTEHALAAIHAFVEALKFAAAAPPGILDAELSEE